MRCRFSVIATPKRCMRSRIISSNASTKSVAVALWATPRLEGNKPCRTLRTAKRLQGERQIRINFLGHVRFKSSAQSQQRGKSDHGGIIGAQPRLGAFEFDSFAAARVVHLPA